ncbi:hypothetical protein HYQ45_010265 [Verticillium longisporum]|uniref:Uncharacterized protein n=1 Tax=Verticillium longisporum TaxID=100787 RepID=A0A8I2ZIC9_VERLO|nr:hypothetical protein HYQ45_010265 [Verticillium longisporum]
MQVSASKTAKCQARRFEIDLSQRLFPITAESLPWNWAITLSDPAPARAITPPPTLQTPPPLRVGCIRSKPTSSPSEPPVGSLTSLLPSIAGLSQV